MFGGGGDVFCDAGAAAVSVLTEHDYFSGSIKDLADAYAVETPDDNRDLYARWAATYESMFIVDNGYVYRFYEKISS